MQLSKIIAHRGASCIAPENTLIAMQYAKELGATWVEFDVMLTQDSVPIIIHDVRLERTTNGRGDVDKTSYSMIKTLDAGSWFDKKFKDERIPSFIEMIDFLNAQQLSMNIEIKPVPGYEIPTTEKVIAILEEKKLCDSPNILISSFSPSALIHARKKHATLSLGLLLEEWSENWQKLAQQLSCFSVHLHHSALSPQRVSDIKNQGYRVLTYTVDNASYAEQLFSWGVDSIFTNIPNLFSNASIETKQLRT